MVRIALVSATLSLLVACGAGTEPQPTTAAAGGGEGGSDGDGGSPSSQKSSGGPGSGGEDASVSVGSSSTGGLPQIAEAYGHTADTLYRLDLDTNQVAVVADFTGCDDDVIDIALDRNSVIYGTTQNRANPGMPGAANGGLWRIDKNTAACTLVSYGDYPNSLSFVPAGTLDPTEEVLVGYLGASYVKIDTIAGGVLTVRPDALGSGLESSGDIVSVIGGKTYLTVRGTNCEATDCVVEVDPATGEALGNLGSSGYDSVFGVAFWAGKLYGFTRDGDVFEFFRDENGSVSTTPIPVGAGLAFYGAGSTTAAPPTVIPN